MARKNILINSGAAGIREVAENSLNSNFIELYARIGTSVLPDATLSYITEDNPNGSVSAGDLLGVWEVAASGASDHHAITAGGVKLYEAGPDFSTRARAVAAHARNVAAGRTIPGGTVWTFPGGKIVRDSSATSISDLSGWEPFGTTAKLSLFGAVGDTVIAADGTLSSGTDDTTAMQAACDWANAARGRKVLGDDGAIYRATAAITGTGDLRVDLGSARIFATANANIFDWEATLYGPYDLATSYTAGDLAIDLTGDPLPVAPLKGTVMKIVSDGVDPGNRDEGSNTNQYRIGEWFVVGSGSTTTNIVLHRPLRFTRAISPTSTAGDEGEVDSYTTTLSARVVYANPDEVFEFTGGVIGHEYGHDASWTADAIHLTGYHSPRVLTHVQKSYGSGVRPYGTVDAETSGCSFADFRADRGYGVSDAGRNTVAKDLRGSNIRHVYSSAVATMAAGETDPAVLIGAGRTVGAQFGGHAEAGSWAHWDTHHSTDGAAMVDAFSEGGGLWSHAARGRGVDIVRPKSRNMTNGIYVFTEYDSGDPDEDYFTAGKTVADFTSARVMDPDIECVEEPLVFANATAKMSGNGKFVAADHCMIYSNGASVIIEGHHDFTTLAGTVSHSRTGCIHLDEANANNGGVLATTLIIEGTVLIDARNASAGTVYGLNLGANCQVIVRGRLKFNLPFGSTLQTGSGTLTVEGDGVVEHYNGTTLQARIFGAIAQRNFASLAAAVAAWDALSADEQAAIPDGTVWTFDGLSIEYDGSTNTLPSFNGWAPHGLADLAHWGVPATGAETLLTTAMQWAIDNSRALVGSGSYEIDDQVTLDFDGGNLIWDTRQATFTASSSFPGSGTKMFQIVGGSGDEVVFDWRMGKFIAGNIPAEGTLSENNVIDISVATSTVMTTLRDCYIDMSDGVNPDYRNAGGDSGILVNSADIHLENITVIGAEDLGIYVTGSSTAGGSRRGNLFARGLHGEGCRNGIIQIKRDFNLVDVEASAKNCYIGGGFGPAGDSSGNTFLNSTTSGHFRIMTEGCAYPLYAQRANGMNFSVSARNCGFYLAADGATGVSEVATNATGIMLFGCEGCNVNGTLYGLNADLVTALGGTYAPTAFTGATLDESAGSGTGAGPIDCVGNRVVLTLVDIPRPVWEVSGTGSYNTFDITATGDSETPSFGSTSSLVIRRDNNFDVAANNNSGSALNVLSFTDIDGSTAANQPMGRLAWRTSDGGSTGTSSYIEGRSTNVTGTGELVFGVGTKGSASDRAKVLSSGNFKVLNNGAGIELNSPDGTTYTLTVDNAGSLVIT